MKALVLFLLLSTTLHAGIDTLNYNIHPGKLHQGGTLAVVATKIDTAKNLMEVEIKYDVIKKPLVPVSAELLKSSMILELPLDFQDERGYLDLEIKKSMDSEKATIYHAGRVDIGNLKNAHHIRILNKRGKFECDLYYHPSVPELGWPTVRLLLNISILKNYEMLADLK